MDHPLLIAPIELRRGKEQEPYAIRTNHGWIARGPVEEKSEENHAVINYLEVETPLDVQFKRFWDTEEFGSEKKQDREKVLSEEDQQALNIVGRGTNLVSYNQFM